MIPPVTQFAKQTDSQVTSNLHRPEKSLEVFDSPAVIMQTDQTVKNDASYKERTVLIKKAN